MDEIKLDTRKVVKVSRKKFAITAVIIFLVIIFSAAILSSLNSVRSTSPGVSPDSYQDAGPLLPAGTYENESYKNNIQPDYYGGYGQPSIDDTREFLKTSYSANIKTRNVSDVLKDVRNIVKGADGRIDNFNSSEKSGRITFVVAKSKFDALRDQIEAITHKKLYSESISSQNLLSQKQGIEARTSSIVSNLDSLNKQKEALVAKHNQTVNSINSELSRIQSELSAVRTNISNAADSQIISALRSQETILVNADAVQRQKLSAENNSYSAQKQNLENQIAVYNSSLANVNKQDSQFTDNIETVNGYVSVNWISLWQLAKVFSPIPPSVIIIVLIILAWVYLKRTRVLPQIEWY